MTFNKTNCADHLDVTVAATVSEGPPALGGLLGTDGSSNRCGNRSSVRRGSRNGAVGGNDRADGTASAAEDLDSSVLSSNHDDGLGVAGGKIRVDGTVNNEQVLGTPDLGISVDNAGAVVLSTHDGATNEVRAADVLGHEALSGSVAGDDDSAVRLGSIVDELLHEGLDGLLVASSLEVRLADELGSTGAGHGKGTTGGGTVGEVDLDLESIVTSGSASTLDVSLNAVRACDAVPEDEALARLGKKTGALSEEVNVGLARLGEGRVAQSREGLLGLDLDGEDGVVLQVLSDGEVEPLVLGGHSEALATAGNSLDLLRGADTRVDEKTGSGESASSEDDSTVGLQVDDLAGRRTRLDFDTGDGLAITDDTHDLGVELELEVGVGLSKGERRVGEDSLLLARLLNGVNLSEAKAREPFAEDVPSTLVNSLHVLGRVQGTRCALVKLVSGGLDILPLPASGPLVVEISGLGSNEHLGVDNSATTKNATGHAGRFSAVFRGILCSFHGRTATGGVHRSLALLEEENGLLGLKKTLGDDQAGSTSTNNDVVVGHVGDNAGEVASRRTSLEVGGLSSGGIEREATKASTMVVESRCSIRWGVKSGRADSKTEDSVGIGGLESGAVGLDAALTQESKGEGVSTDGNTLLNGLDSNGIVVENRRVGVTTSLADRSEDLAIVGPSNHKELLSHCGAHGDGSIALRDRSDDLTDEVCAGVLRKGNTKGELAARVGKLLESDSGLGILVFDACC
ncbi:hypothetical protein HG530_012268 [Fusarium avenaceum]|nr:hypothetical protein HG530_012268 [Fusarium avenaceum]